MTAVGKVTTVCVVSVGVILSTIAGYTFLRSPDLNLQTIRENRITTTLAMLGVRYGWDALSLRMIAGNPEFDKPLPSGSTLLIHAILHERNPVVQRLLEMGANPNTSVPSGPRWRASALALAAVRDPHLVRLLLEHGASLKEEPLFVSPVALAAAEPNAESLLVLLAHGGDPNAMYMGSTALAWAARGNEETVRILIHYGADPLLPSADGRTPSQAATSNAVKRLLRDAEEAARKQGSFRNSEVGSGGGRGAGPSVLGNTH
jgi:ankyrin repeat protein